MELLFGINDILQGIDPKQALFIIANLIIIESLLSVDNAAVLATMVMDLPEHQRGRALKYGIIGAYVFRGVCLVIAEWLINIWWLKPLGGLYLLWLAFDYFKSSKTESKDDDTLNKNESIVYKYTLGLFGQFWATVAMVEVMDLAFSIDNVFAAVAFTKNLYLVYVGVFIGILAMRFVAQFFVKLMEKYPFLETSAFLVIGILGLKLLLSAITHFLPGTSFTEVMDSESTDLFVSIGTVLIFGIPILSSIFLGFPKNNAETKA
ncbi:MAG: TerC family protein [Cytophagaceae bacterium]|jgi:YkoY family integral membrane protein|nr:TerC family protein [Cytophagaceae bacterium]